MGDKAKHAARLRRRNVVDIRQVAVKLGGEASGPNSVLIPGPGHSPRDRSLSVRFDARVRGGFSVYSQCGDDWRACRVHVQELLNGGAASVARAVGLGRSAAEKVNDRIRLALELWDEGRDPRGTLAEKYLHSRGLGLDSELRSTAVRFHPACAWRGERGMERVPVLLVPFRNIASGRITGVQRIRLNLDGTRHGRRGLGITADAAIMIDPVEHVGSTEMRAGQCARAVEIVRRRGLLVIGEGAETCLAARKMGFRPVWALGSVGAIGRFPIIPGVTQLTILGEAGRPSMDMSLKCASRWRAQQCRVRIIVPDQGLSDMNDVLQQGGRWHVQSDCQSSDLRSGTDTAWALSASITRTRIW
jgi:putative DNA primase/helicase